MDILALDYGDRRIGYATASETLKMAFAKGFILNDESMTESIKKLIDDNAPKKIVLGLPLKKDVSFTPATDKALEFGYRISSFTKRDIFLVDERFTTALSQVQLRTGGKSVKASRQIIDAESAKAIAETYLQNPGWVFRFTDREIAPEKVFSYLENGNGTLYFSGAFRLLEQVQKFKGEFSIFELNPYCYSKNRNQKLPDNVREYRFVFSVPEGSSLCS